MKEKKKVCVLHHTGAMGGGTKSFLDILLMLKDAFYLLACIPKGAEELGAMVREKGIAVKEVEAPFPLLPCYSGGPHLFSGTMAKEVLKWRKCGDFVREIEAEEPDVLIFNSIVTTVTVPYFKKEIKKLCFVRETLVHPFAVRFFSKRLREADVFCCFLAEAERKKLAIEENRSAIIPDCMPKEERKVRKKEEARKEEGLAKEDFVLLFMGGDAPIKGGNLLLSAVARLGKEYHLLLGGEVSLIRTDPLSLLLALRSPFHFFHKLRFLFAYKKAEKKSNLTLLGFRKDISGIMSACDVVVFPSLKSHQPRPCIEAGYYGKPVILTDFYETEEYFKDGENALTFPKGDVKVLAEKIRCLKEKTSLAAAIGKKNQLESERRHDFIKIHQKLKEALKEEVLRDT